jgi:hypothetical protein
VNRLRVRYQYELVPVRHPRCWQRSLELWRAYVYECYAADGTLLYVGLTEDPWQRQASHRRSSPWYPDLDHVLLRIVACRDGASQLEQQVIHDREPLYNIPLTKAGHRSWETRRGLKPPVHVERGQQIGGNPALIRRPTS